MTEAVKTYRDELIKNYPVLGDRADHFTKAAEIMINAFKNGGKLLVCGNGGSSADADHIAGELMKGFMLPRPLPPELGRRLESSDPVWGPRLAAKLQRAFPAIALTQHTALSTAYANDEDPALVFAQQLAGYGRAGDVFLGISTSGCAENVCAAAAAARALELAVIGLTGEGGGKLAAYCDVCIDVPERTVYRVQELHLPVYHCLCLAVEKELT